jgi:fructose-1-phosphate kinase PfkB-like protein
VGKAHFVVIPGHDLYKSASHDIGQGRVHDGRGIIADVVRGNIIQAGRCEILVLSLGAAGAMLATRDAFERFRAPTVAIKSKVGAGDSMVAGLVLSLARGNSLREAMLFGISAGAAAVTTPGSKLCRKEDAE